MSTFHKGLGYYGWEGGGGDWRWRLKGSVSGDMEILIKSVILETKNPVLFIV